MKKNKKYSIKFDNHTWPIDLDQDGEKDFVVFDGHRRSLFRISWKNTGTGWDPVKENKTLEAKYDKYAAQLGLYELMHEIYKLENDNKSLRGNCKALGEKNNNQRKEIIRLNKKLEKKESKITVVGNIYEDFWDELDTFIDNAIHNSWYLYNLGSVNYYEDGVRAKVYENVRDKMKEIEDKNEPLDEESEIRRLKKEIDELKAEVQEANDSVTWWINRWNSVDKRLSHLLASDVIKSYDEVNHRTGKYKRNINDLDRALMNKKKGDK